MYQKVTLREHGIEIKPITPMGDTYTQQALEMAEGLKSQGLQVHQAYIDRFDGLVLVGTRGSFYFETPLCGYAGDGPQTSAMILSMFGFGTVESLMHEIEPSNAVFLVHP